VLSDGKAPNHGHSSISPGWTKSEILSGTVGDEPLSGSVSDFILNEIYKAAALIKSQRKTLSS
jgi:hypothetical protein